jgi:hypothetical protein
MLDIERATLIDLTQNNGEIDIVEGVNDQTTNLMTLHSAAGPSLGAAADSFAGNVLTSNCDVNAPNQEKNAGCSIGDTSDLSFGTGFNNAGGGVFATEWTSSFIKIWFFPRGTIPDDVANSNPQPSANWGTPRSLFQGQFDLDTHFKDLQLVFDTTFCGQVSPQLPDLLVLTPLPSPPLPPWTQKTEY